MKKLVLIFFILFILTLKIFPNEIISVKVLGHGDKNSFKVIDMSTKKNYNLIITPEITEKISANNILKLDVIEKKDKNILKYKVLRKLNCRCFKLRERIRKIRAWKRFKEINNFRHGHPNIHRRHK